MAVNRIQLWLLCHQTFLEYPEKITQSMPRFQRQLSHVMDRLMEVTMLIQKLNVKLSTSVPLMVPEALPSIASCVPTGLFSTRTTSSVTGGLTLTVPPLRTKVLDAAQADRDLSEDATTTEGDSKSERCYNIQQHSTLLFTTPFNNKQKSQNSQDISISSQQCNVNNISAIIS